MNRKPVPSAGGATTVGPAADLAARGVLVRIVDAIANPVFVKDEQHRLVLVNDAFCRMLGRARADLVGRTDFDLVPAEEASVFQAKDKVVFQTGILHENEESLTDPSGRQHWIVTRKSLVTAFDGSRYLVGVITDITERRQVQGEVELLQRRLTDALENIGEGFVLWDADDRLVRCNPKFLEFFAVSADLMTPGRSFEEILRGAVARGQYAGTATNPEGMIQAVLNRRREAAGSSELLLSDGRWLYVTNRRTSDGGIVGILSDITERKKGELELREANESLTAAMDKLANTERLATIGQVAATVSHELRNPLGAIRNSMALVHQVTAGKQLGIDRALERVDRNIERCTTIITALLEFTHKREIVRTPTAFDAWLGEVLAQCKIPPGIILDRELSAKAEVTIDREHFRQVIVNLVDNAAQALKDPAWNPPADHARRIIVRAQAAGPDLRLSFIDTGPGIPPEVLPRIFEPLFTTKNFGVGLGLPTVRQIVEQHGGRIEVDSAADVGTTFTVWLPRSDDVQPVRRKASGRAAAE